MKNFCKTKKFIKMAVEEVTKFKSQLGSKKQVLEKAH
jgi:hypothetical protein